MRTDIEGAIRGAVASSPGPDPADLWARGRTRRRRRLGATGLAVAFVIAGLTVGLVASTGRHDGVSVYTNDPTTTTTSLPPPSTIDTSGPDGTTFTDTEAGFTVDLPQGWSATTEPLSGLTDPVERLTAASYPLRRYATADADLPACQVPLPGAIGDGGPADAFATIMEATQGATTSTPDHLIGAGSFADVPDRLDAPLCLDGALTPGADARWIWFGDGHRFFYLAVVIGPDASEQTRQDLWAMLDSFRPT